MYDMFIQESANASGKPKKKIKTIRHPNLYDMNAPSNQEPKNEKVILHPHIWVQKFSSGATHSMVIPLKS